MATLNFKSSTRVNESGPVFQDSVYPSWLHGGGKDTSSWFSDRFNFNGTDCDKADGRYLALLAQASAANLYSVGENDYDSLRHQLLKSTDPGSQTHEYFEEQIKNYQQYCSIQQDFRNRKCSDFLTRGCDENSGFMPPTKDLVKTAGNSSKGIYRLSYNPPIPKNNLMTWSKSDIQLLNQFTSSASSTSSSQSSADHHDAYLTSLQNESGFEFKQRKMVLLDLQRKCEDENLISQQLSDSESLLAYDSRWTFANKADGKTETCDNNETELTNTYPHWESDAVAKKPYLALEDDKSSFASSRLHSVYSTTTSNAANLVETNSAFEEKDMKRVNGGNLSLNQDVLEAVTKEQYKNGLNGNRRDHENQESSANKLSDSETSSTDSSSSHFYFSKSKSSPEIPQLCLADKSSSSSSSEQESADRKPSFFQASDYKMPQNCKSAKSHPIIKSINELLENPYENSECVFCKGNDQTEEVYLSHPIRVDNIVVCPYLRKYVCAICKSTGDGAHTIKYCPFNKRGFFAMREKFPPPNKSLRPLDQDASLNGLKKGKFVQNVWKPKSHRFELDPCFSDQSLYSSTSSLTSIHSTTSSCYSDVVSSNRLFFQNLEKLRKNPKKQDIGCRST